MSKPGSNKPPILQARVIEMSAQGLSGRRIAACLKINRRTVARILAGPEAQRLVAEARERARRMVEKADAALHKSLDRGSSRTAIAVLRGAGVFETRSGLSCVTVCMINAGRRTRSKIIYDNHDARWKANLDAR